MRKDLGKQPAVFPMPVLMVAAYDKNGLVQSSLQGDDNRVI